MNAKLMRRLGTALAALALPLALGSCGEDKEKQAEIDQLTDDVEVLNQDLDALRADYQNLEDERDELNRSMREEQSRANRLEREVASMERELGRLKEDLRRREEREAAAKAPSTREMRAEMKNKIGEHLDAMVEIKGDQTSGSGFVVEADGKTWIYCAASTLSGNSKLEITQSGGGKLEGFGAFELAAGTNLARLELKEPPEKKLTAPTEAAEFRSGEALFGVTDVGVVEEGRGYDPGPTELKADSRLGKCPSGSPVFHGATGTLMGVITEAPETSRVLWERRDSYTRYVQRMVCRLDREVEWIAMPIGSFLAEARFISDADKLTRLVHAFAATQPSVNGMSLNASLEGGMSAKDLFEQNRSVSAVRSIIELDKWLEEKVGRAAETDIRKRISGVLDEIARASGRSTKELKTKKFSAFHEAAAKQSLEWRAEAEKRLGDVIKGVGD